MKTKRVIVWILSLLFCLLGLVFWVFNYRVLIAASMVCSIICIVVLVLMNLEPEKKNQNYHRDRRCKK